MSGFDDPLSVKLSGPDATPETASQAGQHLADLLNLIGRQMHGDDAPKFVPGPPLIVCDLCGETRPIDEPAGWTHDDVTGDDFCPAHDRSTT